MLLHTHTHTDARTQTQTLPALPCPSPCPLLRSQVVSRGGDRPVVAGRLRLVPRLEAVQHEVMAEPTVLLVEGLTGGGEGEGGKGLSGGAEGRAGEGRAGEGRAGEGRGRVVNSSPN